MRRLYGELARKGIRFRPHVWLAEEWFSPDGVPGIAIPFYLAHPRLMRLERRFMHEVEGGNDKWLMRILRHETGHAIDTAFGLRRRKAWRETFGKASRRYPSRYSPRPGSRNYVLHLGHWYAQSHPTEDFAETFAVWLPPRSRWRSQYAGWPALAKLEYVDRTMRALAGHARDRTSTAASIEPLAENERTLREHYRRKQARYEIDTARSYDRPLLRVFAPPRRAAAQPAGERPAARDAPAAAAPAGAPRAHASLPREPRDAHGGAARAHPRPARAAAGSARRQREALGAARADHAADAAARPGELRPMKKLRVLVLVHETLVPPEDASGYTVQQIDEWRTEYDVIDVAAGHGPRGARARHGRQPRRAAQRRSPTGSPTSPSTCSRSSRASSPTTSTWSRSSS